ncbi:MAG: Crp/Fnr family transcriptional regulator, partial [Xanthomonadaceae bacterium]|nr:Crp/Fnr family transcriptional regulator [Xanthomonadaceae bacterium]
EFQDLVLRYTQAMMSQMAQVIMCARRHSIRRQLCRWLLLSFDRIGENELRVTHERIASALGIRRVGVTEAIGRLQNDGFIHGARGEIALLDRVGLEQQSCECYQVIRDEYARLRVTPEPPATDSSPTPPLKAMGKVPVASVVGASRL